MPVLLPDIKTTTTLAIPATCSSTHAELVALCLALSLAPPYILTDSLSASSFGSTFHVVSPHSSPPVPQPAVVRHFICQAAALNLIPTHEKVEAKEQAAITQGHLKAVATMQPILMPTRRL